MFSDKNFLNKVKTGRVERRFSLAKAGVIAGARFARKSASHWLLPEEERHEAQKANLAAEIEYFVSEIGRLKGSIVKVGQMMAVWGESFLPPEVTEALHRLNSHTQPMHWAVIERQLREGLGYERFERLNIDPVPIGCASLGQVHLATCQGIPGKVCLKVQYPGVADSIDSDLAVLTYWLKVTRLVSSTKVFDEWLKVVRDMLHQEVDYKQEMLTCQRFKAYLSDESSYLVPDVYTELTESKILANQYLPGCPLNSSEVLSLSQSRRNHIGRLCMELLWKELLVWGELQTDPNFGNYLVDISVSSADDRLILLDFGAVYQLESAVKSMGCQLVESVIKQRKSDACLCLVKLDFLEEAAPESVFDSLYVLLGLVFEPFLSQSPCIYDWHQADLVTRITKYVSSAALSRHFKVPPKELVFIGRKVLGVYTLMSLLEVKLDMRDFLAPFLERASADSHL